MLIQRHLLEVGEKDQIVENLKNSYAIKYLYTFYDGFTKNFADLPRTVADKLKEVFNNPKGKQKTRTTITEYSESSEDTNNR